MKTMKKSQNFHGRFVTPDDELLDSEVFVEEEEETEEGEEEETEEESEFCDGDEVWEETDDSDLEEWNEEEWGAESEEEVEEEMEAVPVRKESSPPKARKKKETVTVAAPKSSAVRKKDRMEKEVSAPKKKRRDDPVLSAPSPASFSLKPAVHPGIVASSEMKPLPQGVKRRLQKKRGRRLGPLTLFRGVLTGGIFLLAVWAVYGVSLETNLPFWKEIVGPEVTTAVQNFAGRVGEFFTLIGSVHP